ncbi:MAG TPA: isocitrate lyase/PEP mutase family protein [Candidatus Methylomirabilis sp.]|nr:isocitrate lyase/PEP mutase family protein [Candidatus Methylomirabilis sp.]HSC70490.1 isocitrate lyase/PEP mutase family protein [Candidatus Methylomirabilis sp.]
MSMPKKLRDLMREKEYVVTPGASTPLHAMIVEGTGYDFVYMTGYGTSLTLLGYPDVGLLTEPEMVTNARNIARAVKIPVIADADTGFGNAINVIRTVQNYEAAGVAGIHMEDQVSPKRCGHLAGKTILPLEEAVGKIRAAVEAKRDKDFVIIARTDAVAAVGGGLDEALRRGKAYAQAGADMLFCEFPNTDPEPARRFAVEVHRDFPEIPLFFNYSSSFRWYESPLTFKDVAALGYKVFIVSLACMRVAMQAVWDFAADMRIRGAQAEKDFQERLKGHPTEDFNKFAGIPYIKELESKYLPKEEVRKKYEESIGLYR